jgi:hypothetical protein
MNRLLSSVVVFVTALCGTALAQDARNVVEPVIPPVCAKLDANLTSVIDGQFNTRAAADESKLDTDRIQKAIDSCAKGKAVVQQVRGGANAFLSGSLQLREGVTLVVDKGATLFQTHDPSLLGPPLISVTDVSGAGGILFDGYDHDHRAQITLDGVWLTDAANPPTPHTYKFDYADITDGAGGSNIQLPTAATDVTITGKPSEGKPDSCADMFVPFPQQ